MKNLTWQNPEQLFVAQELINKVKSKCCGIKDVLKEHCRKSKHAALAYFNKQDFIKKLHKIDSSEKLRIEMGEKGVQYVQKNYNWELILKRLTDSIEYIGKKND